MIKHCIRNSQINWIPVERVLLHNVSSQNKSESLRVELAQTGIHSQRAIKVMFSTLINSPSH